MKLTYLLIVLAIIVSCFFMILSNGDLITEDTQTSLVVYYIAHFIIAI